VQTQRKAAELVGLGEVVLQVDRLFWPILGRIG